MNKISIFEAKPFKSWITPLTKFNQFAAGQVEQWSALQMESLKAYIDLGTAQARVALKVTDAHSLHEFADSQIAVLSFVGHRMLDDGRALFEWSSNGQVQANRLSRENLLSWLFG